jgi:hypothetical protein
MSMTPYEPFEQFCNGDPRCDGTLRDFGRRLKQVEEFSLEARDNFSELRGAKKLLRWILAVGLAILAYLGYLGQSRKDHALFGQVVDNTAIAEESGIRPR